jgi:tRNA1Val (adenine37-N6)-methyltransferase
MKKNRGSSGEKMKVMIHVSSTDSSHSASQESQISANAHRGSSWIRSSGVRQKPDETLDTLFQGMLGIIQKKRGYRFSLDAILLAHFVSVHGGEKVVDLGTGNGVIPLILASLHPSLWVTGVEIQEGMVDRGARSVLLNQLEKRVKIVYGDVSAIEQIFAPGIFDVAVCNPPYRAPRSGRISSDEEKKIARHEVKGSLQDFLRAAAVLLRAKGRMDIIYPAVRLLDLLQSMREAGVEPKRVRMVHSFCDAEAALALVEGVRGGGGGLKIRPPLVIYEHARQYSAEVASMLSKPSKGSGHTRPD